MSSSTTTEQVTAFKFVHEQTIAATLEIVFQSVLDELGPQSQMMDGKPFPMVFEARPGGRWYRDLGNDTGHFWGHVQVIKPPTLIEIVGPMPMSYAAINHIQYRLTAQANGTLLKFTHQAMGNIATEHRDHMSDGWAYKLGRIRQLAEKTARK